jgi:O-antigen/teichoic acid export membrane protein
LGAVIGITLFYSGAHKLMAALTAVVFFPALIALFVFGYLFFAHQIFHLLNWKCYQNLLKRAFSFWIFAAWSAAGLAVDYLILSQTLTAADISTYHILSKPFLICLFLYNALMLAVWPQCSENIALNQWSAVSAMVRKKLFIGITFMCAATLLILLFAEPAATRLFRTQTLIFPASTIVLFGAYMLLRVISDTYAMVFQSMDRLNILFVLLPLQVLMIVFGELFLSRLWGLNGLLWALIGGFSLTMVWWLPFNFRRLALRTA